MIFHQNIMPDSNLDPYTPTGRYFYRDGTLQTYWILNVIYFPLDSSQTHYHQQNQFKKISC